MTSVIEILVILVALQMKTYALHDEPQSMQYITQFFVHAKNRHSDDHEASDKYHIVVNILYAAAFFPLSLLLTFTAIDYYIIHPKLFSILKQTDGIPMNSNSTTGRVTNSNHAVGSATKSNYATGSPKNSNRRASYTTNINYATKQPDNATSTESIHTDEDEKKQLLSAVTSYSACKVSERIEHNTEDEDAADKVTEDENPDEEMCNRETSDQEVVSQPAAEQQGNQAVSQSGMELQFKAHVSNACKVRTAEDQQGEQPNLRENNNSLDNFLKWLCNKDQKREHTEALLSLSVVLHVLLLTMYSLSIWKFFEYCDELFCHDFDFDNDDDHDCVTADSLIPLFQVLCSALIIFFIYLTKIVVFSIVLNKKPETNGNNHLLNITLLSLGANLTIFGIYFVPYILLAFITSPLQTIFFYFMITILLVVCYFFLFTTILLCDLVYSKCCSKCCCTKSVSKCILVVVIVATFPILYFFMFMIFSLAVYFLFFVTIFLCFKGCLSDIECCIRFDECISGFLSRCISCFSEPFKLLIVIGAIFSIPYFFIIFYFVLTLGSINNFQDAQSVFFTLLVVLLTIFVIKPVYKHLQEKIVGKKNTIW